MENNTVFYESLRIFPFLSRQEIEFLLQAANLTDIFSRYEKAKKEIHFEEIMHIVFVGFSGTGKSHWAKLLAQNCGYQHVCCDDHIEELLAQYLPPGVSGLSGVAQWMGEPFDAGYSEREELYLDCEREVLEMLLDKSADEFEENCVFDTTGSVIYHGKPLLQKLKQFGKVVYFDVPNEALDEMFKLYLEEPKPVIWGDSYSLGDSASNQDALKRCYPKLLRFRKSKYEQIADVRVDYAALRSNSMDAHQLLKLIENS